MASTYVNDLRLNEMATGDESGNWGVVTNLNLELIGEALGYGTEGITTNANTHTTTVADGAADPGRAMYLEYTGTLDSACTITIAPNTVSRMHFIENGTSGSQNIIIKQGSGATITIPPGDVKAVYLDGAGSGAKVVDAFASLNVVDLKVQDDLTVTDDATIGGTLGVTGIVTLTDDLIIGDGKTIGSASDVDAMTIAANGQITLTQTLIGTALDISGDIDVDGTTNLDNTDIDGTLDVSGQVTFADGSAGAPSISNTGDVNAGLFFSAADVMSFSAGGTAQFTMADGSISPVTDNDIDLGTASLKYKSFFAGLTDTENFKVNGGQGSDGQVLTSTGSGVAWEDASGGATSLNGLSDCKTFGTSSLLIGDATTGTIDAADKNTGVGIDVFAALTSGNNNVAVGFSAGTSLTTGGSNVLIGQTAGDAITTASNNIAVGQTALGALVDDDGNVAIGDNAMQFSTDAQNNVAIGQDAGRRIVGTDNVAIGEGSMITAGDKDKNTAVGASSLALLTTGDENTAVGFNALGANTTGPYNTAVGFQCMDANTTGDYNSGFGYNALGVHTTGSTNDAFGYTAGASITTGSTNVVFGAFSMDGGGAQTGSGNTHMGHAGSRVLTSGQNNSSFGISALAACTTGGLNVAIGHRAGLNITTGSNNQLFGQDAGTANGPGGAITTGGNQIVVGNTDSANAHIQIDWTVASDKRDKTDVTPLDMGLSFINKLEPVTYKWDKRAKYEEGETPDGTHKESWTDVGFLAQDVEKIEAEFGHKIENETNLTTHMSEDESKYGLTYAKFIPMLVKSVQELSTQVDELKSELLALKGE